MELSNAELKIIGECLKAIVEGPFIPDWEFPTIFGVERDKVRQIADAWPSVRFTDGDVDAAVRGALGNLLFYPHGQEDALRQYTKATTEELQDLLSKWTLAP